MKKIGIFVILLLFLCPTESVFGQGNFGKPFIPYSKHQRKNLKKFHKGKRHKRFIPFNKSSRVNHPSVNRSTKKIIRRRYNEDKFTRSNY